jgi:nicotinamide mononucleotide adenylyltransferase
MDRGHKVINRDTGEVDDFMPTATEIKNLAPKQRKVDKGVAGAEEVLREEIDKLIAEKNNLYAAKIYLNKLLGDKVNKVAGAAKDAILPMFIAALAKRSEKPTTNAKRDETINMIVQNLLEKKAATAPVNIVPNAAASAAMVAAVERKLAKGATKDELAAAIAAINPAYAGYKPNSANRKAYEGYKTIRNAEAEAAALRGYLRREEVAAKIATALERRRLEKEARKALRNESPMERVLGRMNTETAMANMQAYFGKGKKLSASNVNRLAEIRARGLPITAEQYVKMIRPPFTRREKKANVAGTKSGSINNGRAAAGAGAGAASRGRSATRKAAKPNNNATLAAIAAAMGMGMGE